MDAGDAAVLADKRCRIEVVGEDGAMFVRRERPCEGEAIGFQGDVVMPHGSARQSLPLEAGETGDRAGSGVNAAARQPVRSRNLLIATHRNEPVDDESGAHRKLPTHERAVQRQGEGQRFDDVRRDPRNGSPLPNRLARPPDIERLQVSQSAVNRSQVIERRAAAEIVAFDQGHRKPTLRRVVRDCQTEDAAADDEHVERAPLQLVEIANHERPILLQRVSSRVARKV
jgi:hypothetical protein